MGEVLILIFSSSAVSALITGGFGLVNRRLDKKEKKTKTEAALIIGMQELLCDRIKERGVQFINRGSIKTEELEDILRMNQVYHDQLGGNGFVAKIMQEVNSLPIKDKKGA